MEKFFKRKYFGSLGGGGIEYMCVRVCTCNVCAYKCVCVCFSVTTPPPDGIKERKGKRLLSAPTLKI